MTGERREHRILIKPRPYSLEGTRTGRTSCGSPNYASLPCTGFRVPDEMPCPDGPRLFSREGVREYPHVFDSTRYPFAGFDLGRRESPAVYTIRALERAMADRRITLRGLPIEYDPMAHAKRRECERVEATATGCTLGRYQTHYPAYTVAEIEQARRELERPREPYRIELDPRTSHFGEAIGLAAPPVFPAGELAPPISAARDFGDPKYSGTYSPADVQIWIDGVQLQGPVLEPGAYLEPRPGVVTIKLTEPSTMAEALGFARMCRGDLTTVFDGERMVTTCNACGASEIGSSGPTYCTRYVL
jgi:hypothetical protein